MKVYSFSQFMLSKKTNENSDLDWSDKNWDERGMSGENPPNSGFEGTSSEPMNYSGGDYGENPEQTIEQLLLDSGKAIGAKLDIKRYFKTQF